MPAQLPDDIFGRLLITLFFASLWWLTRLHEIIYEGNGYDRLPDWMRVVGQSWRMEKRPPPVIKAWRWGQAGLFLIAHLAYLIPFYPHSTPFMLRLFLVIACFVIYSACVYYCEKKMGK